MSAGHEPSVHDWVARMTYCLCMRMMRRGCVGEWLGERSECSLECALLPLGPCESYDPDENDHNSTNRRKTT